MFHVKQQDRLTHIFRGGWAPRSQAQPIRVCDIIVLYIMGYYVIVYLITERINMIKQLADVSLKSLDMINKNAENLNKLAEFLKDMQDNQNAMATKILELEKRLEVYERPSN
jgi:predicted PurR-regulated permease PerM